MQVVPSETGVATLRQGEHFLEDPTDPLAAAESFADPKRVAGAKLVVLFGAGLGYRIKRLQALGVPKIAVLEPSEEGAELARQHDPSAFEGARVFTANAPLLGFLLQATVSGDKTVLLVPPAYRRAYPDAHRGLLETLREAEGLKRLKRNTLNHRFRLILETGLRNLSQLQTVPLFTELGRPLEGCPAFVVSAGPSLDRNRTWLPEAARKGAIFTVNTAAPCVVAAQTPIDVLACIESLDVTQSLSQSAAHARLVALDITSAPANFDVQAAARIAFFPPTDPFLQFASMLSSAALPYGASVATAAFALAYHWGADPIVLLGQDLAYTDGRVYATHTGREHMRAYPQGPAVSIEYPPEVQETFREKGVSAPPTLRPSLSLPAWGGGEVISTHDMLLFLRWFETAAHEMGRERTLINATEGGASIRGFREARLRDVLADLPDRNDRLTESIAAAKPLTEKCVREFRQSVARGALAVARAARVSLAAKTPRKQQRADRDLAQARKRAHAAEMHCASDLLEIRDADDLSLSAKRRRTFEALRTSGNRVAQILSS